VFIDTDDRFDAERLRTVARGIVQQQRGLSESRLGVKRRAMIQDGDLAFLLVGLAPQGAIQIVLAAAERGASPTRRNARSPS
jgi:hypothetical protein